MLNETERSLVERVHAAAKTEEEKRVAKDLGNLILLRHLPEAAFHRC